MKTAEEVIIGMFANKTLEFGSDDFALREVLENLYEDAKKIGFVPAYSIEELDDAYYKYDSKYNPEWEEARLAKAQKA